MKKIILAAAALLMCSYGASAQYIGWGVKAGMNLATITKADDAKMKPSIYAGVFAEFMLVDDLLSIQPEVVYSRQGLKFKDITVGYENGNTSKGDLYGRLNYLNIPIMFKLYLIDGLSLDLGPQFGFLLNAKDRVKVDGGTNFTEDGEGQKNFDVSFDMGLSYRFIPQMDVTARYNLGLTKVYDVDGSKNKNSVIQIGLGYMF